MFPSNDMRLMRSIIRQFSKILIKQDALKMHDIIPKLQRICNEIRVMEPFLHTCTSNLNPYTHKRIKLRNKKVSVWFSQYFDIKDRQREFNCLSFKVALHCKYARCYIISRTLVAYNEYGCILHKCRHHY